MVERIFKEIEEREEKEREEIEKLSESPSFFIEVIKNQIDHPIYFSLYKIFPFKDGDELKKWMKEVFALWHKISDKYLRDLVMYNVGAMLSNAPEDQDDKIWPIKYVREVIKNCDYYSFGPIKNGITWTVIRNIYEDFKNSECIKHGKDYNYLMKYWLNKAEKFNTDAEKIRFQYPKIADILSFTDKTIREELESEELESVVNETHH